PQLAWSYHQRTTLPGVIVEKRKSRCTVRAFSFFAVRQDQIATHLEMVWKVDQARTSLFRFSLPIDTPEEVTISAPDPSINIRQYTCIPEGNRRVWSVETTKPVIGTVRLVVDFPISQMNSATNETTERELPLPSFPDVAHQSGLVAVEGNAELETEVRTEARKVDIGELAEAQSYQPGDRLIGAWSSGVTPPKTIVSIRRYPTFDLAPAIAEDLRIDLRMADRPTGICWAAAEFTLRTTPQNLLLELPVESKLYAIHLDGRAMRPVVTRSRENHDGQNNIGELPTFLVDVTPVAEITPRETTNPTEAMTAENHLAAMEQRSLRVIYGIPCRTMEETRTVDGIGHLRIDVPRIRMRNGQVMPVLHARCRILPTSGTRILNETDTVDLITPGGFVRTSERLLRDLKFLTVGTGEVGTGGCSGPASRKDDVLPVDNMEQKTTTTADATSEVDHDVSTTESPLEDNAVPEEVPMKMSTAVDLVPPTGEIRLKSDVAAEENRTDEAGVEIPTE
ncbi:MAG: hypothetical protein Q4C47_01710, partial [Planctomycetia bacterium]|nr:hypothetical protein [Planctomycetia bacterium]